MVQSKYAKQVIISVINRELTNFNLSFSLLMQACPLTLYLSQLLVSNRRITYKQQEYQGSNTNADSDRQELTVVLSICGGAAQ